MQLSPYVQIIRRYSESQPTWDTGSSILAVSFVEALRRVKVFLMGFGRMATLTKWLYVLVIVPPACAQGGTVVQGEIWFLLTTFGTTKVVLQQLDQPVTWGKCPLSGVSSAPMETGFSASLFRASLTGEPKEGMPWRRWAKWAVTNSTQAHLSLLLAAIAFSRDDPMNPYRSIGENPSSASPVEW